MAAGRGVTTAARWMMGGRWPRSRQPRRSQERDLDAQAQRCTPDGRAEGARAFASERVLSREEMLGAPRALAEAIAPGGTAGCAEGQARGRPEDAGADERRRAVGHLPRDSREARTVVALKTGEQATVAVQVRSIAARPVRRRGMKPLVEASVFDETGTMRATFFNQPWLAQRYEPGTRLVLHGKTTERGTFNVAHHAIGGDLGAGSNVQPTLEQASERRLAPRGNAGREAGQVDGRGTQAAGVRQAPARAPRSPTTRRRTARARRRSWRWCRAPETRSRMWPRRCRRGRG